MINEKLGVGLRKELVKFLVVGVVNTVIGLGTMYLLMSVFSVHHIAANAIGYAVALLNSFVWNRLWTFAAGSGDWRGQMVRFVIIFAASYAVQLTVLILLTDLLAVSGYVAQLLSMVVYTLLNFAGNRVFTFSGRRESNGQSS